ncbi:hypothetical protein BJ165DRAFT_1500952, partial [Panaeolus papilionaceus]
MRLYSAIAAISFATLIRAAPQIDARAPSPTGPNGVPTSTRPLYPPATCPPVCNPTPPECKPGCHVYGGVPGCYGCCTPIEWDSNINCY